MFAKTASRLWRAFLRAPDFIIGGRETPYIHRWYLVPRNRFLNIYLHRFKRSDDDRALHDHPWPNASVILKGAYSEVVFDGGPPAFDPATGEYDNLTQLLGLPDMRVLRRSPGAVVFRRARAAHRIILDEKDGEAVPVWTLFITGPRLRRWGFFCQKGWRYWEEFVDNRDGVSETGRGCD